MSLFKVRFDTDNAAFEPPDGGPEIARILRKIADDVEEQGGPFRHQTIFDVNGNDVGRYAWLREDR